MADQQPLTPAHHESEPTAAALTAPGQGTESWQMATKHRLTPSERKALETLQSFHDEPLTFSTWGRRSGLPESTLALAQKRLVAAGHVDKQPTGARVMGKSVFAYQIADSGLVALAEEGRNDLATPRLQGDSNDDSNRVAEVPTPTLQPLYAESIGVGVEDLPLDSKPLDFNCGDGPGIWGGPPPEEPPDLNAEEVPDAAA